jgi:sterol desaturase/sphingolipid hydroxylase (fatty acid hydroxylase superfamily)
MEAWLELIVGAYTGYFNYLLSEVLYPSWHNYFYWLIALSLIVWAIEVKMPWRSHQQTLRKDFWLDSFYMFFNFFLLSLIGFNAISAVGVELFNRFIGIWGYKNIVAFELGSWPAWAQYLLMFVLADFIHWNIHRLLHRVPWLWEFHKVHHSVEEMGFAAHLRFHWMESVIYKTLQYIPLAMLGFGLESFFIIHIIALAIGHLNHANIKLTYGPFKYILNNPVMHLWHHAYDIPKGVSGVNYGLSLSIWDYLFGTAYIPTDDGKTRLGFEGVEDFPKTFKDQSLYPFIQK